MRFWIALLSAYDGAGPKPRTARTTSFDQVPPVSSARSAKTHVVQFLRTYSMSPARRDLQICRAEQAKSANTPSIPNMALPVGVVLSRPEHANRDRRQPRGSPIESR